MLSVFVYCVYFIVYKSDAVVTSQLRTVQSDGLIMYSGDVSGVPGHDFIGDDVTAGGARRDVTKEIPGTTSWRSSWSVGVYSTRSTSAAGHVFCPTMVRDWSEIDWCSGNFFLTRRRPEITRPTAVFGLGILAHS